jgi:hypothetical protein
MRPNKSVEVGDFRKLLSNIKWFSSTSNTSPKRQQQQLPPLVSTRGPKLASQRLAAQTKIASYLPRTSPMTRSDSKSQAIAPRPASSFYSSALSPENRPATARPASKLAAVRITPAEFDPWLTLGQRDMLQARAQLASAGGVHQIIVPRATGERGAADVTQSPNEFARWCKNW